MILWVLEAVLVADVHCIKIRLQLVFGKRKDQYCATHVQSRKGFEVVSDADSESSGSGLLQYVDVDGGGYFLIFINVVRAI